MKKLLALLLVFAMTLPLVACGGNNSQNDTSNNGTTNNTVNDGSSEGNGEGETAKVKGGRVKISCSMPTTLMHRLRPMTNRDRHSP